MRFRKTKKLRITRAHLIHAAERGAAKEMCRYVEAQFAKQFPGETLKLDDVEIHIPDMESFHCALDCGYQVELS